jgi:hypothetical protein
MPPVRRFLARPGVDDSPNMLMPGGQRLVSKNRASRCEA